VFGYVVRWVAALVVVGLAAGCGSADDDPLDAAERFRAAVGEGDATAACRLLAAATLEEFEQTSGRPCAEALLEEVEAGGAEEEAASRYGTMAQVRYGDDVLFLTRGPDGWQVYAAACRPSGSTYDCQVSGG
jgi:hypothetical protein